MSGLVKRVVIIIMYLIIAIIGGANYVSAQIAESDTEYTETTTQTCFENPQDKAERTLNYLLNNDWAELPPAAWCVLTYTGHDFKASATYRFTDTRTAVNPDVFHPHKLHAFSMLYGHTPTLYYIFTLKKIRI